MDNVINDKTPYFILSAAWYEQPMLYLGNSTWLKEEHFDIR
ncbi:MULTISPECIES: hypothetical protein [unclassified Bacillus (in: firmicutes)]|nr:MULTISPECIES: hypothetical protein [unclassified Bacillus (in: firmicutes)]SFI27079.1 hypothetical protein SAMN04488574_102178 [Bacillus sp. 71mf]SFS40160.1 hypothetical protein SAMN04488145_101288 [Bacillus sp. 103mf]